MKERAAINVVNDQLGSPTYAKDLAEAIMKIINAQQSKVNGKYVYHFSNDEIISWFDFATAIKEIKKLECAINPIPTTAYPTPAKRPAYSGLDKTKIHATFNIELKNWRERLEDCIKLL